MKKTTTATFLNIKDAENAIAELLLSGVSGVSIAYVYVDNLGRVLERDAEEVLIEDEKDLLEDAEEGALAGALAGDAVGALAGLAAVSGVVPGIGAIFVGGPLAALLGLQGTTATLAGGAVTGVATGTLVGALAGLGVSESDAHYYEEWIKKGDILVSVTTDTGDDIQEIFKDNNAENILEHTEE